MGRLSKKREREIYNAVSDRLVLLRMAVSGFMVGQGEAVNGKLGTHLDALIAEAQGEAASAAVKAAKGKGSQSSS